MKQIIDRFFAAYRKCYPMSTVFTSKTPKEMMASPVDNEGWFEWKLAVIDGLHDLFNKFYAARI